MQNKGKMTLLSILACTSLMSVGFSAWTVQGGNEEIVNGTIYIDGIESKTLKYKFSFHPLSVPSVPLKA